MAQQPVPSLFRGLPFRVLRVVPGPTLDVESDSEPEPSPEKQAFKKVKLGSAIRELQGPKGRAQEHRPGCGR